MSAARGRLVGWVRLAPVALIGAMFAVLAGSGALKRLTLASLEANHALLSGFVARHPNLSLAAFFGLYALVTASCAPGLFVLTLASGYLFGPLVGGAATLAALVCGGTVVFLACRTTFGDWAARSAGATVARLEAGFSRDAFSYLLALRLMPVAPFTMVTLAAGLARTRLSSFALATLIGSAPSSFVFAGLGAGLGSLFARHERLSPALAARPAIAIPLAGLALLSLAPAALKAWRSRHPRPV